MQKVLFACAHLHFPADESHIGVNEGEEIPDVEEEVEEQEEMIHETMFTFEAFEMVLLLIHVLSRSSLLSPLTEIRAC